MVDRMTDSSDTTEIDRKVQRVESIIERLEAGEVSLGEGKELLEEGKSHLQDLEELLELGEGEVIDLEDS